MQSLFIGLSFARRLLGGGGVERTLLDRKAQEQGDGHDRCGRDEDGVQAVREGVDYLVAVIVLLFLEVLLRLFGDRARQRLLGQGLFKTRGNLVFNLRRVDAQERISVA